MTRKGNILPLVALAMVLAGASYAFTAGNTVPASSAGQGAGTVSGYTVGSVAWNLNSTNPSNLDSVSFTLTPAASNPAATSVKAQLTSGGAWTDCTSASGTWTCAPAGGLAVSSASTLNIVAK